MDNRSGLAMPSSRLANKHSVLHTLHQWNPEFTERRNIPLLPQNKAFVEQKREFNAVKGDDVIRLFTRLDYDFSSSKAREIVDFYQKAISKNTSWTPVDKSKEKIAILDDRDGAGQPRPRHGALDMEQFLRSLKEPVRFPKIKCTYWYTDYLVG